MGRFQIDPWLSKRSQRTPMTTMTNKNVPDDIPRFSIPAIRGIQQYRQFYTLMLPLREAAKRCISRDVLHKDDNLPETFRTQRNISWLRLNQLFKYLAEAAITKGDFVLPAITCLVNQIEFVGTDSTGILSVPNLEPWYLADGQHRVMAIRRLIKVYSDGFIGKRRLTKTQMYNVEWTLEQHIPVTVFQDAGFTRAQQIFADINSHVSKPDKALLAIFDHRKRKSQATAVEQAKE